MLATGEASPLALAVDDASVYWVDFGGATNNATVRSASKAGGATTTLATVANSFPWSPLSIDGSGLYVRLRAVSPATDVSDGIVHVCKDGSCTVGPVAGSAIGPSAEPPSLALDATDLFFASQDGLWSLGEGGGKAVLVASYGVLGAMSLNNVAATATDLYATGEPFGLSGSGVGALVRVSKDGSGNEVLDSVAGGYQSLAVDDTFVFVSDYAHLTRMASNGSGPVTLATFPAYSAAEAIALDADHVYWTQHEVDGGSSTNALRALRKDGQAGGTVPLSAPPSNLRGLVVVDATCVYWVEETAAGVGNIMKVVKPLDTTANDP